MLVLLAACADATGGAGNVVPADPASLPETATPVDGPAFTGAVRDTNGKPVPGASVVVTLLRSKAERSQIVIGAAASLGTTCVFNPRGCRAPTAQRPSALDGTFAVPAPVNNGDAPVGVAVTAVANVGDEADGTRVGTTILLPTKNAAGAKVEVPVAAAPMQLQRSGSELRVRMPPVDGAKPTGAAKLTISQFTAEGDVAGATTDLTGTAVKLAFDLRLAEDSRLLLDVSQPARIAGHDGRTTATRVLAGDVVPASRDAACTVTDSRGKQRKQAACGLTDGLLGAPWKPDDDPRCVDGPCPGTAQHDHRDVLVTLPKAISATMLVARGCGFTCVVTVSSDGRHYRDLPAPQTSGTSGFYVQPLSGASVRCVRVRTATGGFFTSLREVSVFS